MRTELVAIPTPAAELHGALHTPEAGPGSRAAVMFHGNAMNFYSGPAAFLAPALTGIGLTYLAFNRRGHDILATRSGFDGPEGAAFQLTSQAHEDVARAYDWLRERAESPAVVGHSMGGMLGAAYAAEHPEVPALVLLSSGVGGKHGRTQRIRALQGGDLDTAVAQARQLVADGKRKELILLRSWWYAVSAESLLDRLESLPDVLDLAPRITCPVLYVRGEQEDPDRYPLEKFRDACAGPVDTHVVPGADHFYRDCEQTVSAVVAAFLEGHLR